MLKPEHCVEISVPLTQGGMMEGSGYTVGPGLVLTAYHVLFDEEVDARGKITLVWPKAAPDGKGRPPRDKAKRKKIRWYNETLDLALIHCKTPSFDPPIPPATDLVARSPRTGNHVEWASYGFLSKLGDGKGRRDSQAPSGTVGIVGQNDLGNASIKITSGALDAETLWAGFSGSPVFIGDRLAAVVLQANPGRRGASLRVVFLSEALASGGGGGGKTLAEHLGIDLTEDYLETLRAWFIPRFRERLGESDMLAQKALAAFPGARPKNTDALAEALLTGPRAACVTFIEDLKKNAGTPADYHVVHRLAILLLALVFPRHEAVTVIRQGRREGQLVIPGLTVDRLDTEIAEATADCSEARIDYRPTGVAFPYNVSPNEKRLGLDEDHAQAVKDIGEYLIRKSAPGDCEALVKNLWTEIWGKGAAAGPVTKLKAEEKIHQLARRIGKKNRRFYALLPADADGKGLDQWKRLKDYFPDLDLIRLKDSADSDTVARIADLEAVILDTQPGNSHDETT